MGLSSLILPSSYWSRCQSTRQLVVFCVKDVCLLWNMSKNFYCLFWTSYQIFLAIPNDLTDLIVHFFLKLRILLFFLHCFPLFKRRGFSLTSLFSLKSFRSTWALIPVLMRFCQIVFKPWFSGLETLLIKGAFHHSYASSRLCFYVLLYLFRLVLKNLIIFFKWNQVKVFWNS